MTKNVWNANLKWANPASVVVMLSNFEKHKSHQDTFYPEKEGILCEDIHILVKRGYQNIDVINVK